MTDDTPNRQPPANDNGEAARPCPICKRAAQLRYKPFCSKRCADVDLNRWLTGAYALPVEEDPQRPDTPSDD
jgi:uncharacterized protein